MSRADELGIARIWVSQRAPGKGLKLIDVELIVREHHEVLEMLGRGRGVMLEPGKRVIDTLRGEGRQRAAAIGVRPGGAVYDIVVRRIQIRHIEDIAQGIVQHPFLRDIQGAARCDCEMHRHRRVAVVDRNRDLMVSDQQVGLLNQVIAKQRRPRDRGRVTARQ